MSTHGDPFDLPAPFCARSLGFLVCIEPFCMVEVESLSERGGVRQEAASPRSLNDPDVCVCADFHKCRHARGLRLVKDNE